MMFFSGAFQCHVCRCEEDAADKGFLASFFLADPFVVEILANQVLHYTHSASQIILFVLLACLFRLFVLLLF